MANQPFNQEEQHFMETTGLGASSQPPALSPEKRARIASRARQTLGLTAETRRPPAPVTPLRRSAAGRNPRWRWLLTAAVSAAAACAIVLAPGMNQENISLAMEKAIANLDSYHGVVELQWLNEHGYPDLATPARSELWEEGEKYRWITHSYDGKGDIRSDTWFVSDGERQWGLNTGAKVVSVGLAIDSIRLRENLGVKELARLVLRNPHKVVGKETVAGREATKIEVTTPSGQTDYIWIDAETFLPLKAVEWHGAHMQKVITYTRLDVNPQLDPSLFTVKVPEGYQLKESPGQWITSFDEAAQVAGFRPIAPGEKPRRMAAWEGNVALVYDGAVVYQRAKPGPLWTHSNFAMGVGKAGGGPLVMFQDGEILTWIQGGIGVEINGPDPEQLQAIARSIAPDFTLPDPKADLVSQARVKVAVDQETARAAQAKADERGEPQLEHLSPANTAYAFLTKEFGPMAFNHDPYDESDLTVSAMSAVEAIVEVPSGPAARVYVKRLVSPRTDGAWFVVGYDPR